MSPIFTLQGAVALLRGGVGELRRGVVRVEVRDREAGERLGETRAEVAQAPPLGAALPDGDDVHPGLAGSRVGGAAELAGDVDGRDVLVWSDSGEVM